VTAQLEPAVGPRPVAAPVYIGLATRGIAFTVDAAVINLVAVVVAAAVALVVSVLGIPKELDQWLLAAAGAAYVCWSALYFLTFWSTTGQTPGNRLMRIRVCNADSGEVLRPRRSLVRLVGLVLAAIPLFAGFATALFDDRRQGAHDMLAGTVVVGEAAGPPAG
jgi:uncharacterized RDD family membrane protein YckC